MIKNPEVQALRLLGPVRITIPAAVAFDLNAFHKGIANLVERLGCRTCFSGADCTFQLERNFLVNEKLEVRSAEGLAGPHPHPWFGVALPQDPVPHLTVTLPNEVSYNLDEVKNLVAKIAGRLGCSPCSSGFDITFKHWKELLVDKTLNLDRLAELANLQQLG